MAAPRALEDEEEKLPPGWERAWDPVSRAYFYKCHQTRTTQWARPRVGAAAPAPALPPRPAPHAGIAPLPDGWEERWSEEKGQAYYANPFTRTSTWNRPREPAAVVAVKLSSAGPLPEGWTQHLCNRTGRLYYKNCVNKSTQWAKPNRPAREYPRRGGLSSSVSVEEMYRTVLRAVVVDGKVAPCEDQMLSELRQRHGISFQQHEQALRHLGIDDDAARRLKEAGADAGAAGNGSGDRGLCVICIDEPADHAITPCMHMCVCGDCGEQLAGAGRRSVCPVCRARVESIRRIYI